MIAYKFRALIRRLKKIFIKNPPAIPLLTDSFLGEVSGVVHVGANSGQERELYEAYGLRVIWVEPIPEVFNRLVANIKDFDRQQAYQALVTDSDNKEYEFYVSNNEGQSSSILRLGLHRDIWPNVRFNKSIALKSMTLATLFSQNQIDATKYQALIMDTQGSELLVLKGGLPILGNFQFIKTEVADFESYEGCCQLSDLNDFMAEHGYSEFSRKKFASRAEGGNYFDVVYKKQVHHDVEPGPGK